MNQNSNCDDETKDLLKQEELYARLYQQLASEMLAVFPNEGENALRRALCDYGRDRGQTLQAEHKRARYPINLHSLRFAGKFPGNAGFEEEVLAADLDRLHFRIHRCQLFEFWREWSGLQEGKIYCQEIDAALWQGYSAKIKVSQPKKLPDGDNYCEFKLTMTNPEHSPEPPKYPSYSLQEKLQQLTDIQSKMYYHLAKAFCDQPGLIGEAALRRAIRNFGRERGLKLRKLHLDQGLDINLYNMFTYSDLPPDARFRRNKIELTAETRLSETLVCPLYDVWKGYPDGNRLGRIYCEEVHHAIYGAYDEAVQTNLCRTLTQGDDRCVFSIYLRPANRL